MSYIDQTLMQGEVVLYRTKPHWIIFARPVIWLFITILIFTFGPYNQFSQFEIQKDLPLYAVAGYLTLIVAVFYAIASLITYQTSEYGITNKRVLMKIGWIRRLSLEIYLQRVEGVKVYQSVLGRILNYGSIIISGIGGSKDPFTTLPNPLLFRAKVQEQLEKMIPITTTQQQSMSTIK